MSSIESFVAGKDFSPVQVDPFLQLHPASALGEGINPTVISSERRLNSPGIPFRVFVFSEGIDEIPFIYSNFVRLIYIQKEEIEFEVDYLVDDCDGSWLSINCAFGTFLVTE